MPSLWSVTAADGPGLSPLAGTVTSQVAIVGAGYTGLSAALHLAEAAREVVVLDTLDVGEGASGLNGGQVVPGVKPDPDELVRLFGARGEAIVATAASGPDLVFELIRKHSIDCDATRTGWIQPAGSQAALATLAERVRQWQARGAPVTLLSAKETTQLTGSERYCGGWLDRRGGTVQPLSYVRGLARAAQRAGARIFTHSPAVKLERTGRGWRLDTPKGSVEASLIVLATDAYTDRLVNGLRRSIVAIPSLQVATAPIPPALRATILPGGQSASDTQRLLRYFRLDRTGRLVMGTRGAFRDAPEAFVATHHHRAVREIYPQLTGIGFEYHWGGLVAMTPDGLPRLCEVAPGVLAGLGYNGRGVAMATQMGRLLARWILAGSAADLGFPVTPLRPIPLHRFSRIGASLAIQYYRTLDGLTRLRSGLTGRKVA